jgi:pimeloyl-ACP methyl ester carboxylesterase
VSPARSFEVETRGQRLSGEEAGEGPAVVLLHGLTATRRYVVMGSRTLERSGYRTVAYDARGHGRSSPAPAPAAYTYAQLADDLEAVLDELGIERALLAGASMGAHTALRFALGHPERVAALGLVTPSFDPRVQADGEESAPPPREDTQAAPLTANAYNALAEGLRAGGVEGFVRAYDFSAVPAEWRATVETVMRQRLSLHEHPEAVADAMEVVPRSRPFEDLEELERIAVPTIVVASRDEVDPGHPLAVAEEYAQRISGAEMRVEKGGPPVHSPIAWQGGQLSKILVELAARADFA